MAEIKWIKITTDMFDNKKIKHIRKLPEGDRIILIWVMLLSMAGKCNAGGKIYLTEDIPYTPRMLADELEMGEPTINMALEIFSQLKMIIFDGENLEIANWSEYQNVEGMEKVREQGRIRQQNYRERNRKALPCNDNVTNVTKNESNVTSRYDDVTVTEQNKKENKSIDKDIDRDIGYLNNLCGGGSLIDTVDYSNTTGQPSPEAQVPPPPDTQKVEKAKGRDKPAMRAYGQYRNVLLSGEDIAWLRKKYSDQDIQDGITYTDAYVHMKGNKQSDYRLALDKWGIDGGRKERKRQQSKNKESPGMENRADYGSMDDLEKLITANT